MAEEIKTKEITCNKSIGGQGEMIACGYKKSSSEVYLHPEKIILNNMKCESRGEGDYVCELKPVKKYKLGAKWSKDFDYCGMLSKGTTTNIGWGKQKLQKLFDSFEDVNYHTESEPLSDAISALEENDKATAMQKLNKFKQECGKTILNVC